MVLTKETLKRWRQQWRERQWEKEHDRERVRFVEKMLPKNGVGAELGVFKGQFTPFLLRHATPVKLHLIDPWYMLTDYWHWGTGNRSTVEAVVELLKTWKKEIERQQIVVHIGDDRDILPTFPDQYFDWVYVDSSHDYDHTAAELAVLKSKVKADGIIAGDDWRPDPANRHHGVYKAVNEFVRDHAYEIIYESAEDGQWAIATSAFDGRVRLP